MAGSVHGAACLYGLITEDKVRSILKSIGPESTRPDQFSAAALERRHSFSAPIARCPEHDWLYDELWSIFCAFNRNYRFDIEAVDAPLQVIRYPVHGQIDWHVDGQAADDVDVRKLSLSIQLSPSDAYSGGNVEFAAQPYDPFARALGSVICFPSYCAHRVTPITNGERLSLVAFAVGRAFR